MFDIGNHPGLLFVWATLLPMASFVLLLLAGMLRTALRPHAKEGGAAASLYQLLGGDVTGRGPAYVALAGIFLAFVCSFSGLVLYLGDEVEEKVEANQILTKITREKQHELSHAPDNDKTAEERKKVEAKFEELKQELHRVEGRWADSVAWASVQPAGQKDAERGTFLRVGYRIDSLAAIMFVMVTFIATLIHLFSIGYMSEELHRVVTDHEVHTAEGHLHRRGRFGRFFMFLSLFCFSMLNLVLADNLFQVFVSWELVGVCSYLLIGFYYERQSASNAANKAFITNRVGDAGFIIGLLIIWTYVGSFNFQEIQHKLRAPDFASHGPKGNDETLADHGRIITANYLGKSDVYPDGHRLKVVGKAETGSHALLFPRDQGHLTFKGEGWVVTARDHPSPLHYSYLPYWMLVAAGLGIFLGCVGKSAQFPLHVWLPDAMEGPTPVSALIHAATMVAAGVYLVGRCYFLFTPEVLLTIAYVGAITLFVAASIAVVMNDIKKVLAYSTVSQLGYMMLGLGVGGWVAGLFHLVTHAFFKALLFLGSGSVIYGCHHVQDMNKMGGLYPKMKITALTMLVGCFAIAGIPLFSGWYSKDAVLASALGFVSVHGQHFLLFLLPLLGAGITTYYMFRMWFMTFTGKPRSHHVYEHANESPWVMTVPLVLLAFFSITVGWGWPIWNAEASALAHEMEHSQPLSVEADFGGGVGQGHGHHHHDNAVGDKHKHEEAAGGHGGHDEHAAHANTVIGKTHEGHALAGNLALVMVVIGLVFAFSLYYFRILDPHEAAQQFPGLHRFLTHKWYFDELYSALLVRPALVVAGWARNFDLNVIDGVIHLFAWVGVWLAWVGGLFDRYVIDGLANLVANVSYGIGGWLRGLQTGYLRSYVLFLVLAAIGIWVVLLFVMPVMGTP